jgi:hypothetical protein
MIGPIVLLLLIFVGVFLMWNPIRRRYHKEEVGSGPGDTGDSLGADGHGGGSGGDGGSFGGGGGDGGW